MWHEDSGAAADSSAGFDPAAAPLPSESAAAGRELAPACRALRRRILSALSHLVVYASRKAANLMLSRVERAELAQTARALHDLVELLGASALWPRSERDGRIVLRLTEEAAREVLAIRANADVGPATAAVTQVDAAARNAFLLQRERR